MIGRGVGPIPSRIMLVGEAWGADEERAGEPFVGASGQELNRLLHEAGILRSECFVTNVVNARPPGNEIGAWVALKKKDVSATHVPLRDKMVLPIVRQGYTQLMTEIEAVKPKVIVAFGNLAMWALTGKWTITKWRGSMLWHQETLPYYHVIPTIHPASVLREWSQRAAVLNDLRRAQRVMTRGHLPPLYNFIIRPSFSQVQDVLGWLYYTLEAGVPLWIDLDLETRAGHIACIGLSWTRTDAICIPLMAVGSPLGYWSPDEEAWIVWMLQRVCCHPRVRIRGQNLLYDAQYTYRHWHFIPRVAQDTMISQHACFSDLPKALHFIASLYCDHYVYWKDEGKTWDKNTGEEQLWSYNCLDCVYTREAGEVLESTARALGLAEVHRRQQEMFYPVLRAMLRGVRVDPAARKALAIEIQEQIDLRAAFLRGVLGHEVNINSSKQMQSLFYTDLGQRPVMSRGKKGAPSHVTCDDEALQQIARREPLLKPIVSAIADTRTLGKFLGDFVLARLDSDGRMRCSYNIGGSASGKSAPKTYRLSSSKNAFDCGVNLQTIPSEKSKSVGKAKRRDAFVMIGDPYALPNLRSMYIPDPGYTWFSGDLDRADLHAMAWDADDPLLKEALRRRLDIHLLNAFVLDGREPPALDELVESHPSYPDHLGPMKHKREFAKVFAHATDYLGKARTVSAAVGKTIREVERGQEIYLGTYKGIKLWQDRVIEQVRKRRFVENAFGYRWYIFDRIDDTVMPEAVAWIPQSTVSIVINRIWASIDADVPEAQVLLQTHDSLDGQFPAHRREAVLPQIQVAANVIVPYEDPLVIPFGINTSSISWGDCG